MVTALVIFVSQFAINYFVDKTDQQFYKSIKKDGQFEIRYYPPAIMATTNCNETSFDAGSGSNFRKLAGYIFGGNQSEEQIAMTAPVHMDRSEKGSSMSFVMPEGYSMDNLPKPNDNSITLHKSDAEYTASIRYGGFSNDRDYEINKAKLIDYLISKGISYKNNFRFLGYDPPYKILGRRNEVIVSIEWNNKD